MWWKGNICTHSVKRKSKYNNSLPLFVFNMLKYAQQAKSFNNIFNFEYIKHFSLCDTCRNTIEYILKEFFFLQLWPHGSQNCDKTKHFGVSICFQRQKNYGKCLLYFSGLKRNVFLFAELCYHCKLDAFSRMWQICKTQRRRYTDIRTTTCEVHQLITVASAAPLLAGHTRAYDTIEKTRLITIAWHANKGRIILFTTQSDADAYQERHDILRVYLDQIVK